MKYIHLLVFYNFLYIFYLFLNNQTCSHKLFWKQIYHFNDSKCKAYVKRCFCIGANTCIHTYATIMPTAEKEILTDVDKVENY